MNEYTILLVGIVLWLAWILYRVTRSIAQSKKALRAFETRSDLEPLVEQREEKDSFDIVA